jgi:hypothetical protein
MAYRTNNKPVMEWFRYTIYGIQKALTDSEPAEAQFHNTGFSVEELKDEFGKAGFIVTDIHKYDGYNTPSIEVNG